MKGNKEKVSGCIVCSHPHLIEIETASIMKQMSGRAIEAMINENGWPPVSYVTILKHMNNHIDDRRILFIKYLYEKNNIAISDEERKMLEQGEYEINETAVRLAALNKLDPAIIEASILLKASSAAIQEQLALRVETGKEAKAGDTRNATKVKNGSRVVGVDRKPADKEKAYVPLQGQLVTLYKSSSEELRQLIKTKIDILGSQSNYKEAATQETLVDLLVSERQKSDLNREERINKKRKKK